MTASADTRAQEKEGGIIACLMESGEGGDKDRRAPSIVGYSGRDSRKVREGSVSGSSLVCHSFFFPQSFGSFLFPFLSSFFF